VPPWSCICIVHTQLHVHATVLPHSTTTGYLHGRLLLILRRLDVIRPVHSKVTGGPRPRILFLSDR
jgi:hypothetical protein